MLGAVAVQVHGGGAKGEHARVEHERPVAVPGAEEGIDHGGASAWKRRKGGHICTGRTQAPCGSPRRGGGHRSWRYRTRRLGAHLTEYPGVTVLVITMT